MPPGETAGARSLPGLVLRVLLLVVLAWVALPVLSPDNLAGRGDMGGFRAATVPADLDACRGASCTVVTVRPRPSPLAGVPVTLVLPSPIKLPIPPGIEFSTSMQADSATEWVAMARDPDAAEPKLGIRYATNAGGYHVDWIDVPDDGFIRALLPVDFERGPMTIEAWFARERGLSRKAAFEQRQRAEFFAFEFQPVPRTIQADVATAEMRLIAVGDRVTVNQWAIKDGRHDLAPVVWQVKAVDPQLRTSRLTLEREESQDQNFSWWLMQRTRAAGQGQVLPTQVTLEVDRRFGAAGRMPMLVPRSVLAGLHAAPGETDATVATVWLRIDDFAIPVRVRLIAYRGNDAIVVEQPNPRTPAVAPEHWRLLTDMQRSGVLQFAASPGGSSLLKAKAAVIDEPFAGIRPGMKIREGT